MPEPSALTAASAAPPRWKRWLKSFGPFVIATVALTVLLRRYSPSLIAQEMARGQFLAMAPIPVLAMVVTLFIVCAADYLVLQASTGRPSYPTLLRGKAAVTLLLVLGYAAGQTALGVWLARKTGTSAARTAGLLLYLVLSELCCATLVAAASIHWGGVEGVGALTILFPAIAGALLCLKLGAPVLLRRRPSVPALLRPWKDVSPARAALEVLLRIAQIGFVSTCAWASATAFGLPVPLGVMVAYLPVILVVGSLPVNVGGVGMVQGAWLLLTPWAESGEQVLAFSLLFQLMLLCGLLLRGLPFLRRVIGEIADGQAAAGAEAS